MSETLKWKRIDEGAYFNAKHNVWIEFRVLETRKQREYGVVSEKRRTTDRASPLRCRWCVLVGPNKKCVMAYRTKRDATDAVADLVAKLLAPTPIPQGESEP